MVHLQRQRWKDSNKLSQGNVLTTTLPACFGYGFAPYAAAHPATQWNAFPPEHVALVLFSTNQQQWARTLSTLCTALPPPSCLTPRYLKITLKGYFYATLFSAGPRWQIKIYCNNTKQTCIKIATPWREKRWHETSVFLRKQAKKQALSAFQ